MTGESKRRRRAMLSGTVSLRDTHGRWIDVGTAARTIVRGQTVEQLHMLARIYAQAEPYRLEVRTDALPDGPPVSTHYSASIERPLYLIAGEGACGV